MHLHILVYRIQSGFQVWGYYVLVVDMICTSFGDHMSTFLRLTLGCNVSASGGVATFSFLGYYHTRFQCICTMPFPRATNEYSVPIVFLSYLPFFHYRILIPELFHCGSGLHFSCCAARAAADPCLSASASSELDT